MLLQVTPRLDAGGVEQTTLDIARAVVRAGGRAIVASRGGRLAARLKSVGAELVEVPVQSKNPLTMAANALRLRRLIRREGVSIVHARSRAPAVSALLAARAAGVPFVATYAGIYNARSGLKRWYNSVMTRGDLVIANSDYTRAHLIAAHGVDPLKVVTILSGVIGVSLPLFIGLAIVARGGRFLLLAWLLRRYGEQIRDFIEKRLGMIAGAAAAALILLYIVVKYAL